MAICKFQCAVTHSYSQISMHGFHSKADLVESGSHTGAFPSLWNSQSVQGNPSHVSGCSQDSHSSNPNMSFLWPGNCTDSPPFYVLVYPIAIMCLLSLWLLLVLLSIFKGGLWLCLSQASVFRVVAVCPLCLSSLLLAQSLDRKWEIYFIWLELHCSFLTTGVTSL